MVDQIAAVKTNAQDRPLDEQKIASITVDTQGEEYPEPDKLRDPYGRFRFQEFQADLPARFVRVGRSLLDTGLYWFRRGQ